MGPLNHQAISFRSHASTHKNALEVLASHLLGSEDGSGRGPLHKMRRHELPIHGTRLAAQELHLPSLHASTRVPAAAEAR